MVRDAVHDAAADGARALERTVYHVVLAIQVWADQETTLGLPIARTMGDGSVAFLPVFDTAEAAEAAYPGQQHVMIARVGEGA